MVIGGSDSIAGSGTQDTVIGDTGEDVITIWGDGSGSSQDSQLTQEQMEILNQIPEALP